MVLMSLEPYLAIFVFRIAAGRPGSRLWPFLWISGWGENLPRRFVAPTAVGLVKRHEVLLAPMQPRSPEAFVSDSGEENKGGQSRQPQPMAPCCQEVLPLMIED